MRIFIVTLMVAAGPLTSAFASQAMARPWRECANALALKLPYVNRKVEVGLLFGLNKNGELQQFRAQIQEQADRPLLTWFEFSKHGLMREGYPLMFSDKLSMALENAKLRSRGGAFIFFVLDGLDLSQIWLKHGFTNSEVRYLFDHPEYLDHARWFLNGQEVDGRALLSQYRANTGP